MKNISKIKKYTGSIGIYLSHWNRIKFLRLFKCR